MTKVQEDNVLPHEGLKDLGIPEDPADPADPEAQEDLEDQADQVAHPMIQKIGEATRMLIGMTEKDGSW